MLVATLRSDNPHGGASLTCDDATDAFALEGFGEITSAKLLDLENRRQLVWVDSSTRERALRTAVATVRMETAARAKARALAAEAAAGAAAAGPHKAAGIPAASTKFEAPAGKAHAESRVVWSQPSGDEPAPDVAATAGRGSSSGTGAPEVGALEELALPDSKEAGISGETDRVATGARRLWCWGAVTAACLAALGLGLVFPHEIAHQLALSFTRQPTPYTELYFTDPQLLPASFSVPGPNSFRFTVVNHEGREYLYSYVVTVASSHGLSTVTRGTLDVVDGRSATAAVDFLTARRDTQYVVSVTVLRPLETIHFKGLSER
jgi:hypothetical protein